MDHRIDCRTLNSTRGAQRAAVVAIAVVVALAFVASDGADTRRATAAAPLHPAPVVAIPLGIPADLWQSMIPVDNQPTPDRVELGRQLFFDKRVSSDRTVSCATCHDPATAFATADPLALGVGEASGARNSPTVLNAMFNDEQFWDGRADSLKAQAKLPITNPLEMAMKTNDEVVARVRAVPEYGPLFAKAYPGEGITMDTIAKAIASFERTRLSGNSPFDRFIAGNASAISDAAKRGWELFNGKARCISCHTFNSSSPFFSDFKYHNIGVAAKNRNFADLARQAVRRLDTGQNAAEVADHLALSEGFSELGRFMITRQPKDVGAFKTSMLRDIELTAPYMHNGSEKTLLDVVKFYEKGGEPNPNLDGGMRKLNLTDPEMSDIVEFLKTLTSDDTRRSLQGLKPQDRVPFR
jgi:cytochrome c peroxidase